MADITVYGAPWCPDCRRTKKFLGEQRVPYTFVDIEADRAGLAFVEGLQGGGRTIPTVTFADGSHLLEPSNEELARKIGLTLETARAMYDLAIIGGGPCGLAAAVYAAREGIDAVVVDRGSLGGNAGVTERIDNYLGFPEGIGGGELADRFVAQARRYGVELVSAVGVDGVHAEGDDVVLALGNGQEICAHAALVATGSAYRRLDVPGEDELIGAGVHFCATCDGPFYKGADELLVVGGGNSGLEEGLFLSQFARRIRVIERGAELRASKLLQDKVLNHPQFEVRTRSRITELRGAGRLEAVVVRNDRDGTEETWHPRAVFVFVGLDPNATFLEGVVALDSLGFVVTDDAYRTALPGLYAAGDVRSGSTKQLAAAAGEGVAALLAIRQHLQRHAHIPRVEMDA